MKFRTVITKTVVRKKEALQMGKRWTGNVREEVIPLCGEERCWFCCWMWFLFVPGASATSPIWRPVAFAFLALCLVLLLGLVALLALCKYCRVPNCCCGSEFQLYNCLYCPCRLSLVSLFPQQNSYSKKGNSVALPQQLSRNWVSAHFTCTH